MKRQYIVNSPTNNKIGIYKITNNINNKVYIGESFNIGGRICKHFSLLRNNKHGNKYLQNIYNKYGESSFEISIIHLINKKDKSLLQKLEKQYQKLETNCISFDTHNNEIFNNLSNNQIERNKQILNDIRPLAMDKWQIPIILYNIKTKKSKRHESKHEVSKIIGYKRLIQHLKNKNLIPKNNLVAFYPKEFTLENINKIYNSESNSYTTRQIKLYNLITKEILYFPNKRQFSKHFTNSFSNKVFDRYYTNKVIDDNFNTVIEINSLYELEQCNFMFNKSKTTKNYINFKIYVETIKNFKSINKTAKKFNTSRQIIRKMIRVKDIRSRLEDINTILPE